MENFGVPFTVRNINSAKHIGNKTTISWVYSNAELLRLLFVILTKMWGPGCMHLPGNEMVN